MPQFTVNAQRIDPYKNFKFRVKWDGKYVAGVSKCSGLRRTTEVIQHREGGDPSSSHKSPGRTEYEAITLERGVTHDKEFEQWANKVWNFGAKPGMEVSLKDFRKDVILEIYNEAGQLALSYKIFRCWVSEYQILPNLDASTGAIAIESSRLANHKPLTFLGSQLITSACNHCRAVPSHNEPLFIVAMCVSNSDCSS